MFAFLLILLALPGCMATGYICPGDCNCATVSVDRADEVQLVCEISTLHESTPFQRIPGHMTVVLTLVCEPYYISELNDQAFSHLNELEELLLLNCAFLDLPMHLLATQTRLKKLIIRSPAQYLNIPKGFLQQNTQLTMLGIYGSITHIPAQELCALQSLNELDLSDNLFSDISDIGFGTENSSCLPSLEILDISRNNLDSIEMPLYRTTPNLIYFYLNDNALRNLPCSTTEGLNKLRKLNLRDNQITSLLGCEFRDLINLRILYLDQNAITSLPSSTLSPLANLQQLGLSNNKLTSDSLAPSRLLPEFAQLSYLDLGNNLLEVVPVSFFEKTPSLLYLNLTGNRIQHISDATFTHMHLLTHLNISGNQLRNLSATCFTGLHSLINLDLSLNQLSFIDAHTWQPVVSTQLLSLSNNRLSSVPAGLHYLSFLKYLDLNHNAIGSFRQNDFNGLVSLQILLISDNDIQYLSYMAFAQMSNLFLLNLNRNNINQIEYAAFKGIGHLQHLSLNENNISDIEIIFGHHIPRLSTLWLKENQIKKITSAMFPLSISSLDLSNNKISNIEAFSFHRMSMLTSVDLRSNGLQIIKKDVLATRTESFRPKFYLAYNPLKCTCGTSYLSSINSPLNRNYAQIADAKSVICTTYSGEVEFVEDLKEEDFLCDFQFDCNPSSCSCCYSTIFECSCRRTCPKNCTCINNVSKTYSLVNCSNQEYRSLPDKMPHITKILDFSDNSLLRINRNSFDMLEYLLTLFLNNCSIMFIDPGSFTSLVSLQILDLSHNNISSVDQDNFQGLSLLRELNLSHNHIEHIDTRSLHGLPKLRIIRLDHNKLEFIDLQLSLQPVISLEEVYLNRNPFDCSCNHGMILKSQVIELAGVIKDARYLMCYNLPLDMIPQNGTEDSSGDIPLLAVDYTPCLNVSETVKFVYYLSVTQKVSIGILVVLFIGLFLTFCLAVYYRHIIEVWLYAKYGISFGKKNLVHENKKYDAFVSFSERDKDFVLKELMIKLEQGDIPFHLCIHYRDWLVGESISTNIVDSINSSHRTILVLSDNFLGSEWCNYEFQTAHHRALKDKNKHLIIILLQDKPPENLDSDLQLYISTHTYLHYNDPWFWKKILFAMPRLSEEEKTSRLEIHTEEQILLKKQRDQMKSLNYKFEAGKVVEA